MGVLQNPRWERFAQELAKGKTADEAYQIAGYAENRGNATRLKANESVMKRVEELQGPSAKKAEITLARLLDMAEAVYNQALTAGQNAAAIAAVKELGVLSGQRIEKRETGSPGEFDRMSDDELDRFISERAGAAGSSVAGTGTAH